MRIVIFAIFAISLSFFACQPAEDDTMLTPQGFEINFVEGPSDTLVSPGEFATFYFQVSSQDSMLTPAQKQQVEIPQSGNEKEASIGNFLSLMGKGDSAIITIPYDSLPRQTQSSIPTGNSISYHLSIIEVLDSAEYAMQREQEYQQQLAMAAAVAGFNVDSLVQEKLAAYKSGELEGLKESNSGLEYIILDEGSGKPVGMGDSVSVHYYGILKSNGRMFDNSFIRNQAFTVPVGQKQVIPGWDEGLQFFSYGGSGILFIPSELAYGQQSAGIIEPNSDLVFYVKILDKQ